MGIYRWDIAKNKELQEQRELSFEQIEYAIENHQLLDIVMHPNHDKYPNQYLLMVKIENYIVVVPAVKEDDGFFLKTAFPSRKMTKKYLEGEDI